MILALLALTTLILLLTALRARHSLAALKGLAPGVIPDPAPLVSILVPARNEAANILACVRSLLAQDYPSFEVVVVDDRSDDGTGDLVAQVAAADERLRLVRGQPLPPGWTGKSFALVQAAEHARGEWLLFTDADTQHAPPTLSAAMREAQTAGIDFLSLLTGQILGGVWERLVQPVVLAVIGLAAPLGAINDPADRSTAFANGQFILVRRRVYEAIGGHAAVRAEIVEDCELAKVAKAAGYRLVLADGRALVRTRMYRGFRDLWEGWSKNAFVGPGGRISTALAGLGFVTLLGVGPFAAWSLALLSAMQAPASHGIGVLGLATLHLAIVVYAWRKICLSFQLGWPYPVLLPAGALVLDAILVNSAYSHLTGRGVNWKGRRYHQGLGAWGQELEDVGTARLDEQGAEDRAKGAWAG